MTSEEEDLIRKVKKLIEDRKIFVDDIFEKDDIISFAGDFEPEDVFHEATLELWAIKNGFAKR